MKDNKIIIGADLDIKEAEKKLENLKKQIKQILLRLYHSQRMDLHQTLLFLSPIKMY
jgi:hypothetical protein